MGGGNVLRVAQEIDDLVRGVCRSPGVVDHVLDGTDTAQGYGDEIVELDRRKIRHLEGVGIDDARVDVEEAVGSQPPPLVGPDVVSHLVGGEAVDAFVGPGVLIRRVVRHFVLEHDGFAILAVPDDLEVLVVLHKKTVGCDVIPVHDQAVRGAVLLVQPTPAPWSARHAQTSSMITLFLLICRLVVASPGVAPPMRKNTSWINVGLFGSLPAPRRI